MPSEHEGHKPNQEETIPAAVQQENEEKNEIRCALKIHSVAPSRPIDKLPPELLASVFEVSVHSGDNPFKLGLVCPQWMNIVLQTPTLWQYVLVADNLYQTSRMVKCSFPGITGHTNMVGNMQVCIKPVQLTDALSRVGSVPLNVTVYIANIPVIDQPSFNSDTVDMFLAVFGSHGVGSRIAAQKTD
ncbi:hypothetical protein FRC17_006578 [Serendipita sp. 399]|nr:hypothetical protein FRC17_006578 [Serendipita sp. 399]